MFKGKARYYINKATQQREIWLPKNWNQELVCNGTINVMTKCIITLYWGNVSKLKTLEALRKIKSLEKEQLCLHTIALQKVNILQSTYLDLGSCGFISCFVCNPFQGQFALDAALHISIENARNHTGTSYLDATGTIVCKFPTQKRKCFSLLANNEKSTRKSIAIFQYQQWSQTIIIVTKSLISYNNFSNNIMQYRLH